MSGDNYRPSWNMMTEEERAAYTAAAKARKAAAKAAAQGAAVPPAPAKPTAQEEAARSAALAQAVAGAPIDPEPAPPDDYDPEDGEIEEAEEVLKTRDAEVRALVPEISDAEIEAIRAEARRQVAEELRQEKIALLKRAALEEARRAAGLGPTQDDIAEAEDDRLNEEVLHTVNLPVKEHSAWGSQYGGRPHILLDGRLFFHGTPVRVTRAQMETLRDIESQCWRHESEIDGQRRNFYNQQRGVWMTAAGGSPTGTAAHAVGGA
jgi:hypothetical protein